MRDRLPFVTNNTKLAQALQAVGFTLLGVWNVYDDDMLLRLKKSSAAEARAAGLPGAISYFFEGGPTLDKMLAVWDDMGQRIKRGDLPELEAEAEDAMRIARLILDGRAEFCGLWRNESPKFIETNGDTENSVTLRDDDGNPVEGHLTHPGFKLVSVNASKKTRDHLDL